MSVNEEQAVAAASSLESGGVQQKGHLSGGHLALTGFIMSWSDINANCVVGVWEG